MGADDILAAIEITLRKGEVDGDFVRYTGPELQRQFGIDGLEIYRNPNSGLLVTAYPLD